MCEPLVALCLQFFSSLYQSQLSKRVGSTSSTHPLDQNGSHMADPEGATCNGGGQHYEDEDDMDPKHVHRSKVVLCNPL